MSEAPASPPVVSRDGSHWEGHGRTVYHYPNASAGKGTEELLTAANACVYSYSNPKFLCAEKAFAVLNVGRQPFSFSMHLEPDDADQLAAALQQAAQQVRSVREILAKRAAKAGKAAA